eukprot:TRINITY_DN10895_c0_g1_i1.p1 TRINITY_DN10895_c0_g1~~TRINITY_DN10895_c0_g1_i1.p1  ORF type:complete len:500 (-),score=45.87 TRINITY_DN10895_c0_g1_i1:5-1402(-)
MARDVFGLNTTIPWEFTPETACRTVVTPFIVSGVPFYIVKALDQLVEGGLISTYTLLYAPRIWLFLLSFICDYVVWKVSSHNIKSLVLYSTSWTTSVFLVRPFSNTVETVFFALTMYYSVMCAQRKNILNYWALGLVIVVGVFSRFTLIFFIGFLGIWLLYTQLRKGLIRFIYFSIVVLCSMAATTATIVLIDSLYFRSVEILYKGDSLNISTTIQDLELHGKLLVTPYQNLLYNMDTKNLELHGIHPRITHVLVNTPLLFGLLPFLSICGWKYPSKRNLIPNKILILCIMFPLLILSLAPHQEARFLLPILIPISILSGNLFKRKEHKKFLFLWIAFNAVLVLVFGFLHEAGMIDTISKMNINSEQHVLFYKTYMPPTHLFHDHKNLLKVHDIGGNTTLLVETISKLSTSDIVSIVAPGSVDLSMVNATLELYYKVWPHLSTENLPSLYRFLEDLTMNVYKVNS